MSIEMENPETLGEKIDAASNWVAQIKLAKMIGDSARIELALEKSATLLFDALQIVESNDLMDVVDATDEDPPPPNK